MLTCLPCHDKLLWQDWIACEEWLPEWGLGEDEAKERVTRKREGGWWKGW